MTKRNNPLRRYMLAQGIGATEFARRWSLIRGYQAHPQHVSAYANGTLIPGNAISRQLAEATGYEVRPEHWTRYRSRRQAS